MKINITKQKFNQIIKEEVQKLRKIKELESDKKQIEEALIKIQESNSQEEIDELWGGLKGLFNKGAQATGDAFKSAYQGAKDDVNQFVDTVGQKANVVGQAVKQQAQNVKKVYQQGEKEQAIKNTKAEIQNLWNKRKAIEQQLAAMQNKYAGLTGKKLGNQFQSKTPVQVQPPAKAAE